MQIDVVCFSLGNKSLPHQTVHFFEDALYTVFQDKYFLYHLQCILTFVDMLLYFLQESEAAMMKEREWLKL
jgi:hypothetical protein